MDIICLDAEFTETEELLELSVYNLEGKEIYHQYFKPEQITDWRTDIHHITPEMVENELPFSKSKEEVQRLLDNSFALTGFAVGNDIRVLSRSGITGMETKRVIDVKDMYWYLRGIKEDMNPFSVPSLLICANALGLDFKEEEAHSASADTLATLQSFNILFNEFKAAEGIGMADEDVVDMFVSKIEIGKARFIEEGAKGFVKIYRQGDTYKIKYSHSKDSEPKGLVAEIEVADRYKAEYEIKKMLKKREMPGKWGIYKLNPKQLEEVRKYKNTYDAEESAWCKKIVRNLGRLTL